MRGRLARVGITGGVGEGKSTVLGVLGDAGYRVASADDVARNLLKQSQVRAAVAAAAGLDQEFSSESLRDRILVDSGVRRAVNRVLHPRIIDALSASEADFIEMPLLVETALQDAFDEVWVVTCGLEEQRRRLEARVGDPVLASRILALQLPTSAKLPFGHVIVRTNCSIIRVKAYTLEQASRAVTLGVAKPAK